jgi:superfamily II DNA or RNA helicase
MPSKIDTRISQCSSWDDFVELVNTLPKSNTTEKGDYFERLTQVYLQTHPTYSSKLKHVYLLNDKTIPERLRDKLNLPENDEGIDLICETNSGEYWSVQCKYKSDQSSALTYKELSTFNSLSFNSCKGISLGLVVHTSTKPVKKSHLMPKVKEIGLEKWLDISEADWKRITKVCRSNKLEPPKKRNPLRHQKVAITDAHKHFVTNKKKRGKLIMPCGTGKSLTAYWIAQSLKAKTIVVAVPSLALVRQSLADWTAEYLAEGIKPEWIAVCSDQTVGSTKDADSTVATVYEMGIPTNPSDEELDSFLKRRSTTPKIVFTTYQSADKLCNAAQRNNKTFDLLIADEAHKTVGRKDKSFATLLFDENVKFKKRLFMTATERVYNAAKDNVVSMDDTAIYGTTCHQLTFKKAIDAKIICDYKIVTIAVSKTEVQALIDAKENLSVKSGNVQFETDAQSLAAGIALNKAFKKYGIKHALTFHSSIKRASNFCHQQENIPNTLEVVNSHISSKNSAGERAKLLKAFAEEKYSLISNARCLTEGVDIKAIDCVTFVDPKKSTVDIVQAAGRAMRQSKETGKDWGYIILPLLIEDDESLEDIKASNKFSDILKIITSLSTQDERIKEELKNHFLNKKKADTSKIVFDEDLAELLSVELSVIENSLRTVVWEKTAKVNWMPFKEARTFVRKLKLRGLRGWQEYKKAGNLPADIPRTPNLVYSNSGWNGMGDWLGTFNVREKEFWPFERARKFSRSLGLSSSSEWTSYVKSSARHPKIPWSPAAYYKDNGWEGFGDWLGTGTLAPKDLVFRPFKEAREFVRGLSLSSNNDWREYTKQNDFPADIPKAPWYAYRFNGWLGMPDWLGTNRLNKGEQYWSYEKAKKYVTKLNLQNSQEWLNYSKSSDKPRLLPASPENAYKGKGWIGYADFIGRRNIAKGYKTFLPFKEAREFVRKLKLSNNSEWRKYTKSSEFPDFIPAAPERNYKAEGWTGYGDWLGSGYIANRDREYKSFESARIFAQTLKLKNSTEWRAKIHSGEMPDDVPATPDRIYRNSGWKGWGDFLGTGNKAPGTQKWRKFSEARKFARSLKLQNEREWRKFAKSENRPSDIPYSPDKVYKEIGWINFQNFLGFTIDRKKKFRPFEEARTFVRTLELKSFNEWRTWASSGARPSDIPNAPETIYKGKGWIGHPDWMGYDKKR